ncbi:MAG: GNAT family protein [Pseudomonadota bacterium]
MTEKAKGESEQAAASQAQSGTQPETPPETLETPWPRAISAAPIAGQTAWRAPARADIAGDGVRLEPLDPARHGAALWQAMQDDDPARWHYLPYGPYDRAETMAAHLTTCAATADPLFFAILPDETGVAEGVASYLEIDPDHGIIEIGHIWLGPRLSRRRAATAAFRAMIGHAMDDLGYRRMQWKCDAMNAPSRAAARRLGFRYEGVLHAVRVVKGRNRDTAYYSILDTEWPAIRAVMDTWLAATPPDGSPNAPQDDPPIGAPIGAPAQSLSSMTKALPPSAR